MDYIGGSMSETKSESKRKSPLLIENALKESTQLGDSSALLGRSPEGKDPSKSLSMNVAEHLLKLMKDVTSENVNPSTVNAACNCASQMINLMKINLRLKDV